MKKTKFTKDKPQELLLSDDSFDNEEIEEGLIKDSVLQLASDRYDDFDPDEFAGSKLRNINAPQINLASEYGGVSVSRKKLASDDGDVGTSEDDDGQSVDIKENGDDDDDDDDDDVNENGDNDDVDDDYGSASEEMGSGASEQEDDEDEEDEFSDEDMSNDDEKPAKNKRKEQTDENENSCSIYSKKSLEVHEDIEKGNAIRQQYEIWENLLECRIKLQKCLSASNKLPQNDNYSQMVSKLPKPEQNKISKTVRNLCGTLRTLVDLQTVLMNSQPEFSASSNSRGSKQDIEMNSESIDDGDDASISSSIASGFDEDDGDAKSEEVEADEEPPKKKLRQVGDFCRVLSRQHSVYLPARNAAIQKWNDKTRVAAGKAATSRSDNFAAFDQSTLKQIEQILCDKQRLIKRTQTKRSVYSVLQPSRDAQQNDDEKKVLAECDVEIFDDDDFYHKLLRDLIDQRSSDITDSSKMGRQWVELQKARSKMKRNVDVKSTKGRRLRYTVHQKLVNFMAPVPYNSYTDEAESELFNSLFGKLKQ